MKLSDIVRQVNRDIDDEYDLADIKDWVNRCLDDISPISRKEAKTSFTIDLTNAYELPTDISNIYLLMVNGEKCEPIAIEDIYSQGYTIWDNALSLKSGPDTGQIDLYYYRKLKHVDLADDEPEIEQEFHDLFVFYCLGNMQFYDEDYDTRPDSFNRYNARKNEYGLFMDKKFRKNRKNRVTDKVIW